jgi:hypothetical protein
MSDRYIEIEGPYSFKDVDGLVTPAYIYLPGGEKKTIGKVTVKVDGGMTFAVSLIEEFKDIETTSFEVPMRFTRVNLPEKPINWGYNCLTQGIHHGRPEALWTMPLMEAVRYFPGAALQELVISRIYHDALLYVNHGSPRRPHEWAEKIEEHAEKIFRNRLQQKVGELDKYYKSENFRKDITDAAGWYTDNKLNPGYVPMHSHDSINMLCRIIGTSASIKTTE